MSVIISGFLASATKLIVLIFTNIFNPAIETGKSEKGSMWIWTSENSGMKL